MQELLIIQQKREFLIPRELIQEIMWGISLLFCETGVNLFLPILIISGLWAIALFLLIYAKNRAKANVWYSLFLFTVSLGYFVAIIKHFLVPEMTGISAQRLDLAGRFLSAFGNRACPYFILQAAIRYTDFFNPEIKKKLNYWLLVPCGASFMFDFLVPQHGFLQVYIPHSSYFWVTTIWASAYGLTAHFLFFYNWFVEKLKDQRRYKLIVFLLNLPTLATLFISYYGVNLRQMWLYNLWPVLLMFLLFLVFANKRDGVFGVRVTFQNTLERVSSGIRLINHAIKNDLQVINTGVDLIRTNCNLDDRGLHYTHIIHESTQHLYEIVSKIKDQTRPIIVNLETHDLMELINQAFVSSEWLLEQKQIKAVRDLPVQPVFIKCDATHLVEVFKNLIQNAAEAMNRTGGEIICNMIRDKRYVQVTIGDNGCGIANRDLKYIFEPFFTTKNSVSNFGIGLAYVHNVIDKHGGVISVESREGMGTFFHLKFPVAGLSKNKSWNPPHK